jgi:hypothetical protein
MSRLRLGGKVPLPGQPGKERSSDSAGGVGIDPGFAKNQSGRRTITEPAAWRQWFFPAEAEADGCAFAPARGGKGPGRGRWALALDMVQFDRSSRTGCGNGPMSQKVIR